MGKTFYVTPEMWCKLYKQQYISTKEECDDDTDINTIHVTHNTQNMCNMSETIKHDYNYTRDDIDSSSSNNYSYSQVHPWNHHLYQG